MDALPGQRETRAQSAQKFDDQDQGYYANAHPYLELTPPQLITRVPELKNLQPAPDQTPLAAILQKTGEQVDDFFHNFVDLSARELISEQKIGSQGQVTSRMELEDSYHIIRRSPERLEDLIEYRVDGDGNPDELTGLNNGHFLTANSVLTLAYFSTAHQSQSKFRLLGEQSVGTQSAYVVAFAQTPGNVVTTVGLEVHQGPGVNFQVNMLMQGIAWVDKNTFHILRMRTDILAPRAEIRLDSLTTLVAFSEVHLPEVATPLWLPSEASVSASFTLPNQRLVFSQLNFRNEHHYSDHRSYRAPAKIAPEVSEQATPSPSAAPTSASAPTAPPTHIKFEDNSEVLYYAGVHPYFEKELITLVHDIPELKNIRPSADLEQLSVILQRTAENVDDFFSQVVDLIAQEKIKQVRLDSKGVIAATEHLTDSYLILREGETLNYQLKEFRMDSAGNALEQPGLEKGFLLSKGFALSCVYFSSALQQESTFRYLGDQMVGSRDTYVLSFAQNPGHTSLYVTTTTGTAQRSTTVHALIQGIAWVDKSNFQIIRLRTDLLAARPEIGLDSNSTVVTFSKVQLRDAQGPLWLPGDVSVSVKYTIYDPDRGTVVKVAYQNEHHYTDYRRYRVAVKMKTPE